MSSTTGITPVASDMPPSDQPESVRKDLAGEAGSKKQGVINKPLNDKLTNKSSNMTVETETVDTSSLNILPISLDVIPKASTKLEKSVDDSNETFLYDNSLQVQQASVQPQIVQQDSAQQQQLPPLVPLLESQQVLLSQRGPIPQALISPGAGSNQGVVLNNENQLFLNGHSMKSAALMKKPRFTHRSGSFHSIQFQPGVPISPNPESDYVPHHHTSQGLSGSTSHNSVYDSSTTDYTLNMNNNKTNLEKYSDNDMEDDDEDDIFDSSTYDTRSQFSVLNRSPTTAKKFSNRRVASMKLSPTTNNNWSQQVKNKPYSTLPHSATEESPLLRTITSKLFDSKGTLPRRYSGLPPDVDFDDFDDDELDEFRYDRLGDDETDIGNDFKPLKNGSKFNYYGSLNDTEFGNSALNQSRLKKFNRHRDLYFSPHNFPNSKGKWKQISGFLYTFALIIVLLFLGFVSGFLLLSTKDLQGVKIIDISEIIISQEELVFNMIVDGFNPGLINIEINDVEIEVFAKSSHVHDDFYKKWSNANDGLFETVLLGSTMKLDIPLKFQGGFFTRQKNIAISEIKILNPCSNDFDEPTTTSSIPTPTSTSSISTTTTQDKIHLLKEEEENPSIPGDEKWHNISQHPFDLIIRGVLKYNLPILGEYKTVGVNKVVAVDPENLYLK